MTVPGATSANVASGAAHVGVQAQAVHGDVTVYQLPMDASPEDRYRIGVNYLDGGMPAKAREYIDEAIATGHATSEVWFHWLLALLSGRTLRQFSKEDFSKLDAVRDRLPLDAGDGWADGVKTILHLLNSLETPEADLRLAVKEFDELSAVQREKIFRHLELFLKGPLEDQMWDRELGRIRVERMGSDREKRAWIFFHPRPARPRVRPPMPVTTTMAERLLAITAAAVFVTAAGYIGWVLLGQSNVSALLAYLISAGGGYTCAANGLAWRFRVERLRAKDKEHLIPRQRTAQAPLGGFANQVDKLFNRYFARYTPDGVDRKVWLAATAGIRRYLRDEIVDVYRETRVAAEQIAWLIRYRASEVKRCWRTGELMDYRHQFRTRSATKAAFGLGLAALVLGGSWAIGAAMRTEPLSTAAAATLVAASGWLAARSWLRIVLERRRFAAEQEDSQRRLADSLAALDRWRWKLARKPRDPEMAAWLDCDRKVLMDRAMRHYKLAPSQVIAHAFIEAPAAAYKRARVRNGPWRYSRYRLLGFLLTTDGVRQVTADLDFEKGSFHDWQRTSYRFDAVAAVQVSETDDHQRTFELGLVNGQSINVRVTEPSTEQLLQQGEDPELLSSVALDATGLTNTLHVLEGIAAEGKAWIEHERQRGHGRMLVLTSVIDGLLDRPSGGDPRPPHPC